MRTAKKTRSTGKSTKKAGVQKPVVKMPAVEDDATQDIIDVLTEQNKTATARIEFLEQKLEEAKRGWMEEQERYFDIVRVNELGAGPVIKLYALVEGLRDGLNESLTVFDTFLKKLLELQEVPGVKELVKELVNKMTEASTVIATPAHVEGEGRYASDEEIQAMPEFKQSLEDPAGVYWIVYRHRWTTSGEPPESRWRPHIWRGYQNGQTVASLDWDNRKGRFTVYVHGKRLAENHRTQSGACKIAEAALAQRAAATSAASAEETEAAMAEWKKKLAKG